MDTFRYVLAVVLWATVPPAFLYWYLIHPFADYWRTVGPARTYLVVGAACLLALGMLLRWSGPVAPTDLGQNFPLFYAGLILWMASVVLERRVRKQLDFKTLAGVPELRSDPPEDGPHLLSDGIYGRLRHPRYVSTLLGVAGWSMMANYGVGYAVAALAIPAMWGLIRLEERELAARFGDTYLEYRARVPALIPRTWKGG
jgi:protein-S-isoprenylcysteine O-methyltransferase Ste14